MADITSLSALKTHLETTVQNATNPTLSPDNAGLDKLAHFLSEVPGSIIPLNEVKVEWNNQQDHLILSGDANVFWVVPGWGKEGVTIRSLQVNFTMASGKIIFDFTLQGSIQISHQPIFLKGKLLEDESLQFNLLDNAQEQISLIGIANLLTHNQLGPYLPNDIELFDKVPVSELQFTFGFFWSNAQSAHFTSDIGLDWHIVENKIVLKKVGVTLETTKKLDSSGLFEETSEGNIHATLELGAEFDVRLRLQSQFRWIIEIIPKNGNILPGLSSLAGLIGGSAFQNTTTTGLQSFGIDALSIDYAGIGVDIYQKKLQQVTIKGHLTFYGITFFIQTHLPNFEIYGGLSSQTPVHLKSLIGKFFSGAEGFPEIDITELHIAIQPKLDTYALYMGIYTNWQWNIGNVSIGINGFSFQIQKQQKALTGWLEGKFTFLGAEFDLFAQHPEANGGWVIEGHNVPDQSIPIGTLIKQIGDQFGTGSSLPAVLINLEIKQLQVSFNTNTKDFYFFCDTLFPIDKRDETKALDAVIKIELTHNNDKYTRKFSGIVKVGDLQFDLLFQQEQDADTVFLAAFENKAGKEEGIQPLVALITDNPDILKAAEGISFNLKDALLVIDKGTSTKILFGLDIGGGLDLSKLPLIGKMLPENASVRMTFQPLLTNQDFLAPDLDKIRTLVPAGGFQLPKEAKERLGFSMQLMVSQQLFDLSLPIKVDEVKKQPDTAALPAASSAATTTTSAAPPATTSNIKWFVIQKQLGPINFGRVGVQYEQSQLYFLLDASLSLAGLTISLDGLFISSTLNPIQPKFGLHGLGIDYKKGPLEIGGAFLRQTFTDKAGNTYDTYDGTAIIRTEKFALAALGSYAYYQGHPSLFIYAFLDVPLGGPAFFFVTGIAAGFGYNRRVVVPGIDGVATFPLVAEAVSGVPGNKTDLNAEIQKLHEVIPPAVGEYFFAVGIRFNSFKIIDSFALLMVSFGLELEVDVLGLSTLVIPTPDAGSAIEPLAEVQLALRAVFNPDKGYLKVQAVLTSASFILSRECHLTGGFAFYTWFKDNPEEGASAGEFVLTIGGYHPAYKPPAHYPKVPLLGFNWQVIPELIIKGDLYFALVPSAVMAGGYLSATFTDGGLKAWFKMGVDFIISWKPYFYDAHLFVDFGVSYTFELFGTHTLTLELGADLHIWGPEFSGTAQIHIWIFTVGINFGAGNNQEPPELSWKEFREGFLPAIPKWESVAVTQGLINQLKIGDENWYIVNPKEFVMETSSALPITTSNLSLADTNTNIQIGSMGISDQVTSSHNIVIKFGNKDVTGDFSFTPIKKNAPSALWGKKLDRSTVPKKEEQLVKDTCMGFSIKGKAPQPSSETHSVDSEKLLNEKESFGKGIQLGKAPAKLDKEWLKNKGVRNKVTEFLESKQEQRTELLKALGFNDTYYPNKELADEFVLTGV